MEYTLNMMTAKSNEKLLLQWYAAMGETASGRITLNNLLYDFEQGRLGKNLIRELLDNVLKDWSDNPDGRTPEGSIATIAKLDPPRYFCQGTDLPNAVSRCSRIMLATDLVNENIELSKIGWKIDDNVSDRQIARLEKSITSIARGHMRGARPFAWVTHSDSVDLVRADNPSDPATVLRDLLGLYHFNQEQKLVEVQYPPDFCGKKILRAPTFIEGSPGLVYRSTRKTDGWGRTVHLQTHEDSLPEAVHPSVPFNHSFSVRRLGRLRGMRVNFDWHLFATNNEKRSGPNSFDRLVTIFK